MKENNRKDIKMKKKKEEILNKRKMIKKSVKNKDFNVRIKEEKMRRENKQNVMKEKRK